MSCFRPLFRHLFYLLPSSKIYMFHHLSISPRIKRSNCVLETSDFYEFVSENRNYVSLDCLLEKYYSNVSAITFDDGLSDVYDIAYPYLKKRDIPFTIFVVTDFLDKPGYLTTEQLIEMSNDPLVTIGSHGVTHHNLASMTKEEQVQELEKSKALLSSLTSRNIIYYAYSHGSFNKDTIAISKTYHSCYSVIERPVNCITINSKYKMPRYNIDSTTIEKYLHKKIESFGTSRI